MENQALPTTVGLFPLTGSLLLPGNYLPLNVFEERYRNLVEDALAGPQLIGMIQPVVPRQDNRPDPHTLPEHPELYEIGCLGRIEQWERQEDGRYLILLKGLTRFRVERELTLERGYRRVEVSYAPFRTDPDEPQSDLDPGRLLAALESFAQQHQLSFDMQRLRLMPGVSLVNGLAVALPFSPAEKQALLESEGPEEREELLLSLMDIGLEDLSEESYYSPPTVN